MHLDSAFCSETAAPALGGSLLLSLLLPQGLLLCTQLGLPPAPPYEPPLSAPLRNELEKASKLMAEVAACAPEVRASRCWVETSHKKHNA